MEAGPTACNDMAATWKYYVYQFFSGETCVYVGKGCGNRFEVQKRRFSGFRGQIMAYFRNEKFALSHERGLILSLAPEFNKAHMPKTPEPWKYALMPHCEKDFYPWCDAIGTRAMAARIVLSKPWSWLQKNGIKIKDLTCKVGNFEGAFYGSLC